MQSLEHGSGAAAMLWKGRKCTLRFSRHKNYSLPSQLYGFGRELCGKPAVNFVFRLWQLFSYRWKIYAASLYLTGDSHCFLTSWFRHLVPVLVSCGLVWIGYVMVKWQISPEMSVAQYDKQSFLTLNKFSTVWASFLVMLSLCRHLGIWASSTPWFSHRRVRHLQLCKWGREKAQVKIF